MVFLRRLCQANVAVGNCCPSMDEDDTLHWPVMFVYPETMQQDLIQDVAEIHTLEDHLNEVVFHSLADTRSESVPAATIH